MFIRKNMQWRTFKFRRAFKYIGRLYSFRKGALAYRGFLLRFIHYYFLLYYFYYHSLKFYKASYRRVRRKFFKHLSRRHLFQEFHLYWRYFRKFFRRHWNYESTIRLGTTQQRSKLFRRRFAIFHLLFKLYHEPLVKGLVKLRLAKALKARAKAKHQRYVKVSRYVRITFPLWRRWYRNASRKFFSKARLRRKHFFNLIMPHLSWPTVGRAGARKRRRFLGRAHGLVAHGSARLRRNLCGRFRFTRFLRTLKGSVLRFLLYGFFRPAVVEDSLFVSAGVFSRDPGGAAPFGFQRSLERKRKRTIKKYYSSSTRSLLFRGRKRKFFIGYIPFGVGTKPLQQIAPAYDFSLGFLKLSFFFRGSRRAQFFLARSAHKGARPLLRRRPSRTLARRRPVPGAPRRRRAVAAKRLRRPVPGAPRRRRAVAAKRLRRSAKGTLLWDFNKRYI